MTSAIDASRALDHGQAPTRYARGWHCLGLAEGFRDGKPHRIEAFEMKLVVWSDTQGKLNVIDGYCRHMGGDLTQGTVRGDNIACPFHDWRWGGDGRCKEIPYTRRVPMRARTERFETAEVNGQLFIWHDPEGSAADFDILPVTLPDIDTLYTPWSWHSKKIEGSHCRELIDNVADMAHFYYVHFAFPTSFRNVFEGHTATQYMTSTGRPDKAEGGYSGEDSMLESVATYYGPAYMINWLKMNYKGFVTELILLNTHLPTGPDSFLLQYGIAVKKPEGMDEATVNYIAERYVESFSTGFLQDVAIWENKTAVQNPLLCEDDGPVYQLRRWYEQFYVDKADIAPEMVERFEFEVDTSKANEYWHAEVAENLRLRAEAEAAAGA